MNSGLRLRTISIFFLLSFLILISGCRGCRKVQPPVTGISTLGFEEQVEFKEAINYCLPSNVSPVEASIQILIDASGSMTGYKSSAKQLSYWVRSAISRMEGAIIRRRDFRLAHFNKVNGIFNITRWNTPDPALTARHDTNLDDAIVEAGRFDLTFIITDGVAATGSSPTSRCAGGVDAACVARVLADVRQTQGGGGEAVQGIWILPIVATYDGIYYTEQPRGDFDAERTIRTVKADVGVDISLTNPGNDNAGNLIFQYKGPRSLLLFILSKNAEVGRSAVSALYETALTAGATRLNEFKEYKSGIAVFEPLEIYPGFIQPVAWKKITEESSSGNIDVKLAKTGSYAEIRISGEKNYVSEGNYRIEGESTVPTSGAGCVPLHILPSFKLLFQSADQNRQNAMRRVLKGFKRLGEQHLALQFNLAADLEAGVNCSSTPLVVQYVALLDYKRAADALAGGNTEHGGVRLLKSLSTSRPKDEPHKIFNFASIFQMFYMEVRDDQKRVTLSNISLCVQ